jgi:hypothetical protein
MSFTLATLKTAIQDYLQVDETTFNNSLDTFIVQAEDRIFSMVQFPAQQLTATISLIQGARYQTTPVNFYSPIALYVASGTTYTPLLLKNTSFMREYAPNSTTTGLPRYYAIGTTGAVDDTTTQLEITPVPDQAYSAELVFVSKPASLTSQTDGTVVSEQYPDLILYGALVEAAIFLKEAPDVLSTLENRFKENVGRAKNMTEGRNTRDENRFDQLRSNVS